MPVESEERPEEDMHSLLTVEVRTRAESEVEGAIQSSVQGMCTALVETRGYARASV